MCGVNVIEDNSDLCVSVTVSGQPCGTEWSWSDVHVRQRCHTGKCH